MGYYTDYTLEYWDDEDNDEETLREILVNYVSNASTDFDSVDCLLEVITSECINVKWYKARNDVLTLSKAFPAIHFELTGVGEEREDMWRFKFFNGEVIQRLKCEMNWVEESSPYKAISSFDF